MTKYIDRYYLNGELYGIKFGGTPTPTVRPDIHNATSDNKSKIVSSQYISSHELQGICLSNNGQYLYYCDLSTASTPVSYLYQYTLSTPRDITTATETSYISFNTISSGLSQPSGIFISDDGNYIYIAAGNTGKVVRLTLSTPYMLNTATLSETISLSGNFTGISINDNGTKMYIPNYSNSKILEYSLPTAWALTGATQTGNISYPVGGSVYRDIMISALGEKLYIARQDGNIYQMDMSTNFDITTATYDNEYKNLFNGICGLYVNPDGSKLYVTDISTYTIYQYSL